MAAKDNKFGIIEGTLVYAKVGQPDTKYQSTEKEWSVEVIVNEDVADAWDSEFKKQPSKKIKASEFEAKYKIPLPAHLKGEKNVFGIKLRRVATKDGVPVDESFRPKVYVDDTEGNRTEIGQAKLVANGSFGKVSYYISVNDFGRFSRLQNVLMDEDKFIEYESTGGKSGDEFGSKPVKTLEAKQEVMQARKPKATPEPEPEPEDEDIESSPF